MNRSIYGIGYNRLGVLMLPTKLRQKGIISLVGAMMKPLSVLHTQFILFSDNLVTPVNSQTCKMEAMLNDKYDYYNRGIKVVDVEFAENEYFLHDDIPILVGDTDTTNWFDDACLGNSAIDFEILFPSGYDYTDDEIRQIRQLVNSHKLASKNFKIRYNE